MPNDRGDSEETELIRASLDADQTLAAPQAGIVPASLPLRIGRHRIVKILGEGGFGRVYLAHDDDLDRAVAIKVPRVERISQPEDIQAYLEEAKMLARLDHPSIVPVLEVGRTDDGLCFVVSKFIAGTDLAGKIKQGAISHHDSVQVISTIADALHYAHSRQLVHRDVKPANILMDGSGRAFLADFGLALKDEDYGKGSGYAGTPAYMSPEQARGEGHRVDGRSDIFSLGVVFYELLTGKRPFRGDSHQELMEEIASAEAGPPRQFDDSIPKELERICLKALAKRATERYTTAKDMAEDLHLYLKSPAAQSVLPMVNSQPSSSTPPGSTLEATPLPPTSARPDSDSRPIRIVPKGLRSFDHHDADFFLELLPGARDRDGLPESVRFWKTRIEEMDADHTFTVGLIYGPSGCGKSSMVKAGLLPRISPNVIAVHLEATAEETETRLLNGLRKRCQALPDSLSLKHSIAALRRGEGIPAGKKILIVLDQFEQWLHAKKEELNTELVQALRQCDGIHVQCVVMVRDDFWMAATRFMRDLEVRLVEAQNSAAVDLFDLAHARKVLIAFGRAFGKLPESSGDISKDQKEFLNQAVSGLSQEGKVISVRLALFAEMMKGKPWTPASLKEVGGTEGVGVTFLEETFGASTAPPEHRYHQKAAREVLKAMLPESETDIKGHMRSYEEILDASGYASRRKDFDDLIRLLDSEIRLITPTDPDGKDQTSPQIQLARKYYQLTHDYLVPSLRDWLTRKQKETRQGRAELLLADRASVWNARPENRQLPSLRQWSSIRWLTTKKTWTPPQRKMMRRADKHHAIRGAALGLLLTVTTISGLAIRAQITERQNDTKAAGLVQAVLNADIAKVPDLIVAMSSYRKWADPKLRQENEKADFHSKQKLHASLALLPDPTQVDYLRDRLLDAAPNEIPVIIDLLKLHKSALLGKLWSVVEAPQKGKESQRLRAAAALAKYDPASERWTKAGALVANDLVRENPVFLGQWKEAFVDVKNRLIPQLTAVFRDARPEHTAERSLASNLLADCAADQPTVLADLIMDADEKQFAVIYPKFAKQREQGLPLLISEIDNTFPSDLPSSCDEREILAKRQANAAVGLLKLNQPDKVWPILKHSPDPRARSYVIHRLGPLGADAKVIAKRLDEETEVAIQGALIQSLGEFSELQFSPDDRKALLPKLQEIYQTAPDPGVHASVEWLLRTKEWKQEAWLKQVNDEWAVGKMARGAWRVPGKIQANPPPATQHALPAWYVNGQGQTMVVIPEPKEFFWMGSPPTEAGRMDAEIPHKKRIGRTFALAAKLVTWEQYLKYAPEDKNVREERFSPTLDCPVNYISWYTAAKYCNWLSKEEGFDDDQQCYEIKGNETKLKANYLKLMGYRLPTEAEMEYATRAGAVTARYYGETVDLLPNYAWYQQNSEEKTRPVGTRKPNDLGLFDAQGNVFTWCQESHKVYPKSPEPTDDQDDDLVVESTHGRVFRGGSFLNQTSDVRSAIRYTSLPTTRNTYIGFRPARTFTP